MTAVLLTETRMEGLLWRLAGAGVFPGIVIFNHLMKKY